MDNDELKTEENERKYLDGQRSAWNAILHMALRELGYHDQATWVNEREQTIAQLRMLCEDYGDNEWDDHDFLADIVEKHLVDHLNRADHQ